MSLSLRGRVVVVTRPRNQSTDLEDMLRERGAQPILAPAIHLTPAPATVVDRAIEQAAGGEFDWILFTSQVGVEAVFRRLDALGLTASALAAHIGAVGPATAQALEARGVRPELVPRTFTTEALTEAMPSGAGRVLLARADIAPEGMETVLEEKGWTVQRVDAYRTVLSDRLPGAAARALANGAVDAVTFTSASTVDGWLRMGGPVDGTARVVCIGPVTAGRAEEAKMIVAAVAEPHTIEGLVAAIVRVLPPPPEED
jgi:uroporphyrinogen III methyltransferase/synthase